MKLVRLIVSGKVQGVFYRDFVRREAGKLGVSGYVRNLSNGTVEVIARGTEDSIKKLSETCWKGPLMASVENVEISEMPGTEEFDGFDIKP